MRAFVVAAVVATGIIVGQMTPAQSAFELDLRAFLASYVQFIAARPDARRLDAAIDQAARDLGVEAAALRAVVEVEGGAPGVLLFEAHIFSHLTDGEYDARHPDISSPGWDRTLYRGGIAERARVLAAAVLDPRAAAMSASWGRFQILGRNYALAGFDNPFELIAATADPVDELAALTAFIRRAGLLPMLRRQDWTAFARGYNGRRAAENGYARRLARAYERLSR